MAEQPLEGLGLGRRQTLSGILFLLGIDTAYNVYGGTNSSPQTTDVFGDPVRRRTLMKYVYIGGAKTIVYTAIASVLQRSWWPLIGGSVAAATMHWLYCHAAGEAAKRGAGVPAAGGTPSTGRPLMRWRFQQAPTR
jgi:hypothetical protein